MGHHLHLFQLFHNLIFCCCCEEQRNDKQRSIQQILLCYQQQKSSRCEKIIHNLRNRTHMDPNFELKYHYDADLGHKISKICIRIALVFDQNWFRSRKMCLLSWTVNKYLKQTIKKYCYF